MTEIKNQKSKLVYQVLAALFGWFALILQLYLIIKRVPESGQTYLSEIIRFLSYMTIWTNILVTLTFTFSLIAKKSKLGRFLSSPIMETGTMLYITVVGISYHFLLSHIWAPVGLQKVADVSLHYFVPAIYIVYWFLFVKKGEQQYSNSYKWLLYPLVYLIYALIHGAIVNTYAYPFIDVNEHGYGIVLRNSLFLGVAYFIVGVILVFIDKVMAKSISK